MGKKQQSVADALRVIRDPDGTGTTQVSVKGPGETEFTPMPAAPAAERNRFKIPPDAEAGILERAGKGDSLREICDWLHKTHGIRVTPTAIRKKLAKTREVRSEATKTVIREKLAKTALSDIDVLDREKRRLRVMARRLFNGATERLPEHMDPADRRIELAARMEAGELYLKTVDRLAKVIDTKLHYSGADTPDDGVAELLAAERALASGMAGVAERLRQAGVLPQPVAPREGGPQ